MDMRSCRTTLGNTGFFICNGTAHLLFHHPFQSWDQPASWAKMTASLMLLYIAAFRVCGPRPTLSWAGAAEVHTCRSLSIPSGRRISPALALMAAS